MQPTAKSSFEQLTGTPHKFNKNPNLSGNSANFSTDNSTYFSENGWTVHPVVDISK